MGDAVLELEIAEPSLYLAFGEGAANRFAKALSRRLSRCGTAAAPVTVGI